MTTKVDTEEVLTRLQTLTLRGIKALPPLAIPKVEIPKGNGDTEEVVLLLSDLQIGLQTPTTNAKKIRDRLDKLAAGLIKIVTIHRRAYPVQKLNIFLLGDK